MSTSKHTPGPWEIVESLKPEHDFDIRPVFRGHAERDSRGRAILEVTPPQCFRSYRPIATVKHDKRLDKAEAAANARLIAAAPELLEALIELSKSFIGTYSDDERSDNEIDAHRELWEGKARAAIAKAEGEQA